MDDTEIRLTAAFNIAREALPELTAGSKPLAMGSFGIVIAHNDDTLTKLFFRQKHAWLQSTQNAFVNEVHSLQFFAASPITDIQTPILIGEPEILDHDKYMGVYRMTRIVGNSHSSFKLKKRNATIEKLMNKNAGQALAKFHRSVGKTNFEQANQTQSHENNGVIQVDLLGSATNKALAKADDYLQEHMQAGIIHGDYHGGNIIMDEDYNVTGLIDFSSTRKTQNIYSDFAYALENYRDDFIHGYEEESNMQIDRHMITASALAGWSNYLNETEYSSTSRTNIISAINGHLDKISSITGFRP